MTRTAFEVFALLLPGEQRSLTRTGVQIHNLQYWDDSLAQWVGQHESVRVLYDPRDITFVYVRTPVGLIVKASVTTPNIPAISLAEWQARRAFERLQCKNPEFIATADESQKRGDQIVSAAKAARKLRRRRATQASGDRMRSPSSPTMCPTQGSGEMEQVIPESNPEPISPQIYEVADHDEF
jgi:putative transposase